MRNFLWMFRVPESLMSFVSGGFISYAINIFTSDSPSKYQLISAAIWLCASVFLVFWIIMAKRHDEIYQTLKDVNIDQSMEPKTKMARYKESWESTFDKGAKAWAIVIFLISVASIVGGIAFIIIAKFI